jgi:hypothetical protein
VAHKDECAYIDVFFFLNSRTNNSASSFISTRSFLIADRACDYRTRPSDSFRRIVVYLARLPLHRQRRRTDSVECFEVLLQRIHLLMGSPHLLSYQERRYAGP